MAQINVLTPPDKAAARSSSLHMRLSPEERTAIDTLAQRLGVQPSHMVRHFILQIVTYYNSKVEPVNQSNSW